MTTNPAIEALADYPRLGEHRNQQLIRRAKGGDRGAEDTLIRHSAKLLKHILRSLDCADSLVDDLFQEGQIALRQAIRSYRGDLGASWTTYAHRAAYRDMVHALGYRKNTPSTALYPPAKLVALTPVPDGDPEEHLLETYDRLFIRSHLCNLRPREQHVITAYFELDGLYKSLTQLAQELGVTPRRVGAIRDLGLKRLHYSMTHGAQPA